MNQPKCDLCKRDIHSITTRSVGTYSFCPSCFDDYIAEPLNEAIEKIVNDAFDQYYPDT